MFSHVAGSVDSLETGYEPLLGPIEEIPPDLPRDLESTRQKLVSKAKRMLEEGVLELEGDD